MRSHRIVSRFSLLLTAGAVFMGTLFANPVFAFGWVKDFFGPIILYVIFSPFMVLLNILTYALLKVAMYNGFADAAMVREGWVITRDISNMFFVFILLIIAIGTIVKWQKINFKQNLRRLVLMALLINFSKTITLFFIDISQIFMLTFMTEVSKVLQVGMITALGLDRIANPVSQSMGDQAGQFAIGIFTYIMAGIMVVIACLVVAVMVVMLIVRVITLWLLITFSPLAFIASALPQTEKYYNQWWDMLGKQLTIGPVLAFMLWLAFKVVASKGGIDKIEGSIPGTTGEGTAPKSEGVGYDDIIGFITAIGILIFAIRLAIQTGGIGGSIAARMQGAASGAAKKVGNRVAWGKSGEGGVLGRAKSGALATAGAATGGLAAVGVPLAGRLSESVAVARGRQAATRKDAEAKRYAALKAAGRDDLVKEAEERTIGKRSFAASLAEQKGIKGAIGRALRTASAPQRQALIEGSIERLNEKDINNDWKVKDEEVQAARRQLQASGANKAQLEDFDKKTFARGLNAERYKESDEEVIRGEKKAGEFKNEAEGKRVEELMTEMQQDGKLNADWIARDAKTSYTLTKSKRSVGQLLDTLKSLPPELADQIQEMMLKDIDELSKTKVDEKSKDDRVNGKLKKKLEDVLIKRAPDKLVDLVGQTNDPKNKHIYENPVNFERVANRVDKEDLGKLVSSESFAQNVHLLGSAKASEILTGSDPVAKRAYSEALFAKMHEVDPKTKQLTDDANKARRNYANLVSSTSTQVEMDNQVTEAVSRGKNTTGTPEEQAKAKANQKNAEEAVTYHTSYVKDEAAKAAQRELSEAEGKIEKHFTPGQKVKHYGDDGQGEEDWEFLGFDKASKTVKIRKQLKSGTRQAGFGASGASTSTREVTADVPLSEFRRRNFF